MTSCCTSIAAQTWFLIRSKLAVTWHELDYDRQRLIGPTKWWGFFAAHRWRDDGRAERLFSGPTIS